MRLYPVMPATAALLLFLLSMDGVFEVQGTVNNEVRPLTELAKAVPSFVGEGLAQLTQLAIRYGGSLIGMTGRQDLVNGVFYYSAFIVGKAILFTTMAAVSPSELGRLFNKRSGDLRSSSTDSTWSDDYALRWAARFLRSEVSRDWACLQRSFCENPEPGRRYVRTARTMLQAFSWLNFGGLFGAAGTAHRERITAALEDAVKLGQESRDQNVDKCAVRYGCAADNVSSE